MILKTLFVPFLISNVTFASQNKVSTLLLEMKSKYKSSHSLTCEVEQLRKNSLSPKETKSEGRIYLKKPNLFRWETFSPDPSILTTNGKKIWFYTPPFDSDENGQVVIRAVSKQDDQSKFAFKILSGEIDVERDFEVSEKMSEISSTSIFILKPKKPLNSLTSIELELEKPTKLVYRIRLILSNGNETTLKLRNLKLNAQLPNKMFEFQIPKNTEVLN